MGNLAVHYEPVDVMAAYGRRYTEPKRAIDDWYGGLDFKLLGGPYLSVRDSYGLIARGYSHVRIIDVPTMQVIVVLRLGSL